MTPTATALTISPPSARQAARLQQTHLSPPADPTITSSAGHPRKEHR